MQWMLWCATVRTKSIPERIEAMKAAGLTHMSLFPIDYKTARESGLTDTQLQQLLRENNIRVVVIDPYTKWLPGWEPPAGMSKKDVAFVDFDESDVFHMAEIFQAESINVIETFGKKYAPETMIEHFARFCDKAAARGNYRVHLEFMPFSAIPDLNTAWNIVRTANRENGGVLLDTWHYYRGNPDHALLKTIPGEKIFRVQLADADRQVRGDLMNDLLHYRKLPGQGDFDLVEVLRILEQTGGLSSIGPELFSDEIDKLTAQAAVEQAMENSREVMKKAGVLAPSW